MSGTTAIVAFFKGNQVTVANVGDSRAIVGERKGKRIIAYSLSIDQTPYRADERERVKAAGAVVMSCDQLEGIVPFHENWGVNLGEELDNGGDPPRVWAPGKSFPGCAFTRSIGDHVAEGIGVTARCCALLDQPHTPWLCTLWLYTLWLYAPWLYAPWLHAPWRYLRPHCGSTSLRLHLTL